MGDGATTPAFGQLLRRYRGAAGLTQEELAERCGLTAQAIGLLERGERQHPHPDTVQRLAEALALAGEERVHFEAAAHRVPLGLISDEPATRSDRHCPPLPAPPTALVGRSREVAALARLVGSHDARLVTLTGPGGVGKSRLALEVATQLDGRFADGVAFVSLAAVRDPAFVPTAVASLLGIREGHDEGADEGVLRSLAGKRLLLVLDNFEQVAAGAPWLAELLAACPTLRILVTSRIALRVRGEQEYRVSPLPPPNRASRSTIKTLARNPAVELFVRCARAARSDFALTAADAPAVAEIVRRLDGLPLAIELAAARIKVLPPPALLARLGHRLDLLIAGAHDLPARQQTLRRTLAWSYELLDAREQTLFRRLSVFAGSCELEAAERVCAGDGIAPGQVVDLLARLIDHSLLQAALSGPAPRYLLLETTREFASEQLEAAGEAAPLGQCHADWCLALAEGAERELRGPGQQRWLDRLEREHDNLRVALHWLSEAAAGDAGLRLAGALAGFWQIRGYFREGQRRLEQALVDAAECPGRARVKAHCGAGTLAREQGEYQQALTHFATALAQARCLGDRRGTADALQGLGVVAYRQGHYLQARNLHEQALALRRELGDDPCLDDALNDLGNVLSDQGDVDRALRCYQEALARRRDRQDAWGLATTLNDLGNLVYELGDDVHAKAWYEESLALRRALGDQRGVAATLINLGHVVFRQGDLLRAQALYKDSLARQQSLGSRHAMAIVLGDLGSVALGQQEYARARALYAESWALTLELQDQPGQVCCLERLASLARAQGDHAQAISLFSAAEGLRVAIGGVLTPFERGEGERAISALRETLDAEAFTRAWLAGQVLAPEEAFRRGLAGERMLPATRPETLANAAPETTPLPPRSPEWQRCALPPAPPG